MNCPLYVVTWYVRPTLERPTGRYHHHVALDAGEAFAFAQDVLAFRTYIEVCVVEVLP